MEFLYVQNPNAKKPIILVNQYIGTDAQGRTGIDEAQFTREILALKNAGVTQADLWVNSKGGLWSVSVGIVNAMNNSGIDFTTYNHGFVDSAAGHIFQAGKRRVWMSSGIGLVHEIQGNCTPEVLDAMNNSVATMLCTKTLKTKDEVRALMAANTMMDATMARDYGFCDDVDGPMDILRCTNSAEAYEAGEQKIKKLLPKNKNMEAVNTVLGLTNDANEASQLAAINKIITARNAAETALATANTDLTNTRATLTDVNAKLVVAENSILTATNEAKRVKAEALVKEHIGTRIVDTPENITRFTNMAVADYDNAKAIIEAMNVNKTAPKTPALGTRSANAPVISVGEYMSRP